MKFFRNDLYFKKFIFFKKNYFHVSDILSNQKKSNLYLFNLDYDHYVYSFFIKKSFLKLDNRFNKFKANLNKNLKNHHLFLRNSIRSGNKLKILNFLNKMRLSFYWFFQRKVDFFEKKFPSYNMIYDFSTSEKKFFDFNFILDLVLKGNERIFYTKIVKIGKHLKNKNKTKVKYDLDVNFLKNEKRKTFTLKLIHLYANIYNFYNYNDRLLMSFFNTFFLHKDSEIYKNKIMTYKALLKKNSK